MPEKTPDVMRDVTTNLAPGQTVKTNLPPDREPGSPVRVDRKQKAK